jgi:peroxiredoxin
MLQPPDSAPDFELPLLTGGSWRLSDALRESPVLLAFYKISCPTCQLTFPYLQRLADSKHAGAPRLVAISQDNAADTTSFMQRLGVTMPTLIEDSRSWAASNAYKISSVPSLFLVTKDGTIATCIAGFHRAGLEDLAEHFAVPVFGPEDKVPDIKPG